MKKWSGKISWRSTVAAVAVAWLGIVAVCWGAEEKESAFQKHLMKIFKDASRLIEVPSKNKSPLLMEVWKEDVRLGFGAEVEVVSRSGPFPIWVIVSPDEKVLDVQIPKYPHKKGRSVRKRSFLDQFKGIAYGKPLKLGEQVDGVTGATSSAKAITGGVRSALLQVHKHQNPESEKRTETHAE